MAAVGITEADALAVISSPIKTGDGDFGRINASGYGANGVRVRVTYHATSGEIRTVAIADKRFP